MDLLPLLFLPVGVLTALAAARLWVVQIRPDSIQGSDLHMLKWAVEHNTRCWLGFHVELSTECDFETEVSILRSRISAALAHPQSNLRRTVDRHSAQYRFDPDLDEDQLLDFVQTDAELLTLREQKNRLLFDAAMARAAEMKQQLKLEEALAQVDRALAINGESLAAKQMRAEPALLAQRSADAVAKLDHHFINERLPDHSRERTPVDESTRRLV